MHNHAPPGYDCPFCRLARGLDTTRSSQDDVVYRTPEVTAFVAAAWWPHNPGHVLIVPNAHHENIYDLPDALAGAVHRLAREVALAFKAVYGCDGVSTRQHNEPAGNQDVWHYHLHVFPRYAGDDLYLRQRRYTTAAERVPYAARLRAYFAARARPASD